jgi:hypothetical protein
MRAFLDPEVFSGGVRIVEDEPAQAQTRVRSNVSRGIEELGGRRRRGTGAWCRPGANSSRPPLESACQGSTQVSYSALDASARHGP